MNSNYPKLSPPRPLGALTFLLAGVALAGIAFAAPSTTVVISQVYGGGGNSGATHTHDFVELHNISSSPVSLAGWSLQYGSGATGNTNWTTPVASLSGTIPAGGYYLVMMQSGGAVGSALPTPDASATGINMGGAAGKLALVNSSTVLTTASFTGTAPTEASIVDFVGYGTTVAYYEGAGRAPAPSATNSISRLDNGSTDSDINSSDFGAAATPSPRNSASTPYIPGDVVAPTLASQFPTPGATGVALNSTLSLTFSEVIQKGTGHVAVLLADHSPVYSVDVTTAAVAVSGSTATITLPGNLTPSTAYYVTVTTGAFKDGANNNFAGITGDTAWTLTTGTPDVTPPAPTTYAPAVGSSSAHPQSNLVLTFDEPLVTLTGGVEVFKSDNTQAGATLTIGSGVTVSGNTVTINPTVPLDYNTQYYVNLPAGLVEDAAGNDNVAINGIGGWHFTTRPAPKVVISQTYEGTSAPNHFVELKNVTGSPVELTGYRLAVWSDTPPSDNEGWKSGTGTTTRVIPLDGYSIPANGYFLYSHSDSTAPAYAAANSDLKNNSLNAASFFDGDDSVVLYDGPTNIQANIADAVSISANNGIDLSFFRLSDTPVGYDFQTGTSAFAYPAIWGTSPLSEVNTAAYGTDKYLTASQPPKTLTLELSLATIPEGSGPGAVTATVTRTGSLTEEVFLTILVNRSFEVAVPGTPVSFAANSPTTNFPLEILDDSLPDGARVVTITVQADGYVPGTAQLTVTDDGEDPAIQVVINEVDADQAGTDSNEFIELHNASATTRSLEGLVLVLYNGSSDTSYDVIELSGEIPANDYFVIGNSTVANVDQEVSFANGDGLQNGADAIVLCLGSESDFPNGSPMVSGAFVLDAMIYGTADPDDTGLINGLNPGKPQVNEGSGASAEANAMARVPNGGAAFDTTLFVAQPPTPGASNSPSGLDYDTWAASLVPPLTGGATGDADNDGRTNEFEFAFGLDPKAGGSVNPFVAPLNKTTAKFTYTRREGTILDYKVYTSTTLATGSWVEDAGATQMVTGATGGVETVEVTLSAAAPLTAPKLFLRVVAE